MYVYSLRRTEFTAEVAPDLHCYWPLHLLCRTTSIAPPCAGEWVRSSAAVQSAGRGLGATAGTVRARVCVVHLRLVCARPCNVVAHCVVVVHYHHCQPRHRGWPGTRAPHPGCHHGRRRQHASHGAPRRRQHASHGAAASSLDPRRPHGWNTSRPYDHRGSVGTTPLDKYPRQAARTRGSHSMVSSQPHPPAVPP